MTRMRGFPKCMSHCDYSILTGFNAEICGCPCVHYPAQPPTSRVTIEKRHQKDAQSGCRRFIDCSPAGTQQDDDKGRRGGERGAFQTIQGISRGNRDWHRVSSLGGPLAIFLLDCLLPGHVMPPSVATRPSRQLEDYPLRTVTLQTVVCLAGAAPRRPPWCQYLALTAETRRRERQRREATKPRYQEEDTRLTIHPFAVRILTEAMSLSYQIVSNVHRI